MLDKQNVETIYSLAPLQQMFLWHSLQTSTQAGLLHICCDLEGALNAELLHQAWFRIIRRHPVLRTSVHWENVKQPLQVVARQVEVPWQVLDWRGTVEQEQALDKWLIADRDRSFDLTQPPIMRLTLIRLNERIYKQIWSCHHLMLDGWSGALILNQVLEVYEALSRGQEIDLAPAPSYQTYIQWLKQQDESAAESFWKTQLKGLTHATPLPFVDSFQNPPPHQNSETDNAVPASVSSKLSVEKTQALQAFLRSNRLTLSSFIQGIWAILLYSYSQTSDVVFGVTVSGRQGDLAGVEAIAGLLINVLPARVQISPETKLLDYLETLQEQQRKISPYAYSSPSEIQAWSGLSQRLFNSLLVIDNYPIQAQAENETIRVRNIQSGTVSNYDLTIIVKPEAELGFTISSQNQIAQDKLVLLLDKFELLINKSKTYAENPLQVVIDKCELSFPIHAIQGNLYPTQSPENLPTRRTPEQFDKSQLDQFSSRRNLEIQLQAIWGKIFNTFDISLDENFFDIGGNSLLAAQFFTQVQATFDHTLPLALLFQAPTIRKLVDILLLQESWSPSWSSLVPIQPLGSKTPLFFMHPIGGNVLYYKGIGRFLGQEQPFYGLQSQGLDGISTPNETIEGMAAHYITEIQRVQPQGPYFLGGFCMGGAIAFEMAKQLDQQGETVELLALLDPAHSFRQIGMHPPDEKESGKDLEYYVNFLRYLFRTRTTRSFLKDKFFRSLRDINHLIRSQEESKTTSLEEETFTKISMMNKAALEKYKLSAYPGKITYIQSSDYATGVIGSIVRQKYFNCSAEQNYLKVATSHHQTITNEAHLLAWVEPLQECLEATQTRVRESNKSQLLKII